MGLFRRTSQSGINWKEDPCTPVDALGIARELLGRAPRDGRYFVAWLVDRASQNGQTCLLAEQPATRTEAQRFLQQMGSDYRTRPQRVSEYSMDGLDGMWVAQRRGFPEAILNIIHPDFIEMAGNGGNVRDLASALGHEGKVAAIDDPNAFFARDWSVTRRSRSQRTVVEIPRYSQLLNTALGQASPLADLDPPGLDSLAAASQALADHTAADLRLKELDEIALDYLSKRLTQSQREGMAAAAFFNPSDRSVRENLNHAKESADREAEPALALLQQALRRVFTSDPSLFRELQIDNSTLAWLYLDDIVDAGGGFDHSV